VTRNSSDRGSNQKALPNYTRESGRSFGTHVDQVIWPQTELFLHLKKHSAFMNTALEDITMITPRFETSYSIDGEPRGSTAAI
jgi:hypothetical protein